MDSKVNLYLKRARNEIETASLLFNLSGNKKLNEFNIDEKETFYSAVISHSYYCIFYSAKAILLKHGIETKSPNIHQNTLKEFENHLVKTGIIDLKFLEIYKKLIIRADELLEIFKEEKRKRGHFTYETLPQANVEPAKESLENAKKFHNYINTLILNS